MAKYREVTEDHTFWEQARLLEPDAKRLDQIIDAVKWLVSTHAEECHIVERNLRVAFTDPFPDAPSMRIFFTIKDENQCTLHWIEHISGPTTLADEGISDDDIPF
jgi:hypothetical protein